MILVSNFNGFQYSILNEKWTEVGIMFMKSFIRIQKTDYCPYLGSDPYVMVTFGHKFPVESLYFHNCHENAQSSDVLRRFTVVKQHF